MSPSDLRKRLDRNANLLDRVSAVLNGAPAMQWGEGERITFTRMLRQHGVELVSRTAAKRRGHRIKRRARPLAVAYFGAPIQLDVELFVFDVHTAPLKVPAVVHLQLLTTTRNPPEGPACGEAADIDTLTLDRKAVNCERCKGTRWMACHE